MKNNEDLQPELEAFAECLFKDLDSPLDLERKTAMKMRVMSRLGSQKVASDVRIENAIADMGEQLVLSADRKAMIKERIFDALALSEQKRYFWLHLFRGHKKLISSALVVAMVVGIFSGLNLNSPSLVIADSFATLDDFKGTVSVEREGERIDVYEGMVLQVNDRIYTGEESLVVVDYLGNGVTRSGENTDFVLREFTVDPVTLSANVEVELSKGKMWSRVNNNHADSANFVVNAKDVSAKTNRGTFNVNVEETGVEVEVFSNAAVVESPDKVEKVKSGYKVVSDEEQQLVVAEIVEDDAEEIAWVQENLESDKNYVLEAEGKLIKEREVALETQNVIYDKTVLLLTFDDVERAKKELDIAEGEFLAAQVDLASGEKDGEERLDGFAAEVEGFQEVVEDVRTRDEKYAEELDEYLDAKLTKHAKELRVVLPDSPLYESKELVSDLRESTADSEEEVAQIKKEKVLTKLSEVEDAVFIGDSVQAEKALEEYKKEVSEVIETGVKEEDDLNVQIDVLESLTTEEVEIADAVEEVVSGLKVGITPEEEVVEEEVVEEKLPVIVDTPKEPEVEKVFGVDVVDGGKKPLPPELGL